MLNVECASGGLNPCQELWLVHEEKLGPLPPRCPPLVGQESGTGETTGQQRQTVSCEGSDGVAMTAGLEGHTEGRSGKA